MAVASAAERIYRRGTTLMPAVLPPGLTMARQGQPLAHVLAVTVQAVPLVIATVALIPALAICPFLRVGRQCLVIRHCWPTCGSGRPCSPD